MRCLTITVLFFMLCGMVACKKETPEPVPVKNDADTIAAIVDALPLREKPVIITDADIAVFIDHFPGVNDIAGRYEQEMEKKERNGSLLHGEGQREIQRHLKKAGLDPKDFMRKAAKIIRGWLGIKLLRDPAFMEKDRAAIAAEFTDPLERLAAETQARNGLKERSKLYLRSLSGEERALMEKHYEELSTVLKDIPVE